MKTSPEYQAKWFKAVEDYKSSDLSMKKYALAKDINYYQFQYWVRKYKAKHKEQPKQFVRVETNKAIISSGVFKITYGKLSIELPDTFNESSLLKILKVADQVV